MNDYLPKNSMVQNLENALSNDTLAYKVIYETVYKNMKCPNCNKQELELKKDPTICVCNCGHRISIYDYTIFRGYKTPPSKLFQLMKRCAEEKNPLSKYSEISRQLDIDRRTVKKILEEISVISIPYKRDQLLRIDETINYMLIAAKECMESAANIGFIDLVLTTGRSDVQKSNKT